MTAAQPALAVTLIGNHAAWMEAVVDHFRRDEVAIALVDDCFRAVDSIERTHPGFIVLDVDAIDAAVLEVCRKIRAVTDAHITICGGRGGDAIVVAGFAAGADDVLTGRHSSRELAARMRAVLRRRVTTAAHARLLDGAPRRYTCGSLTIDVVRREVHVADDQIDLTRIQFDILVELAKRGGAVTTREDLVQAVWGPHGKANLESVTMHVGQLRRRLGEDPEAPDFVFSVRGVGYRLGPRVKPGVHATQGRPRH